MPKINFIKMNNCNKVLVTFKNDAFRLWDVVLSVCYSYVKDPRHESWVFSPVSESSSAIFRQAGSRHITHADEAILVLWQRGRKLEKVGGMWRVVPTIFIVIYKYIKYAIKIVDSFPLQLLQKLLSEECSPNSNKLNRFSFSNHY